MLKTTYNLLKKILASTLLAGMVFGGAYSVVFGAIARDANSTAGGSATLNFSHTTSGTGRYLFCISTSGNQNGVSGVTYNGVAMSLIGNLTAGDLNGYVKNWGLVNPALGTNTVSVTGSGGIQIVCSSYTGASATQAGATNNGDSGGVTTSITKSVTTVADKSWVIGGASFVTGSQSLVAGSGANQVVARSGSASNGYAIGIFDSNGQKTPAGSYSMTVDRSGSTGWMSLYMIELQEDVPVTTQLNQWGDF